MNVLNRAMKKAVAAALSFGLLLPMTGVASAQVIRVSLEAGAAAQVGRSGVAGVLAAPGASPVSSIGSLSAPTLDPLSNPEAALAPIFGDVPGSAIEDLSSPEALSAAALPTSARQTYKDVYRALTLPQGASARQDLRLNEIFEHQSARTDAFAAAILAEEGGPSPKKKGFAIMKNAGPDAPVAGDVQAAAIEMHKEYEAAAAKRIADFKAKAAAFRSGRFTVEVHSKQDEEGAGDGIAFLVDGRPMEKKDLRSGAVSKEEYARFRKDFTPLAEEFKALLTKNEEEHAAVHAKMEALVREAAVKKAKATLDKGMDLQSWGVPEVISINQEKRLRYARLYRMGGRPTNLGEALQSIIAPLLAADPDFLSKVTQGQLHVAVQFLSDSLKYSTDAESDDFQKASRLGFRVDDGYDYPEWKKALTDRAVQALTQPYHGPDKSAGLGLRPKERQPVLVLRDIFNDTMAQIKAQIKAKMEKGANPADLLAEGELMMALHATMGIPMPVSEDQMGMVSVQHRQLLPILAELRRREAHNDVVEAVIRSFPMGESLPRLGVHKLWERGITGKGVKVAVIDNGIDFNHPDFIGVKGYSENLTRDRGDHTEGGHATPMASILHSIAPDAEIQSYQVLSNTELPGVMLNEEEMHDAVLKAMDNAAANGAQVLSMSLGFPIGYGNGAFARKVSELSKKGVTVIVSAGNSGDELPNGLQVGSPGSAADAITVGAVDYHGNKAFFSSGGQVFNPETHTVSDKPEIFTYGLNVKAAMQLPAELYAHEPVPYHYISGTSPATPHIVGVAALMLQAATEAGATVAGAALPTAIKAALLSALDEANQLPVLKSAEKAVQEFVKAMTATPQA